MIKYFVVKSKVEIEDIEYNTYGITGNGITIHDISTDKNKVEKFVDTTNRKGDVSVTHIPDLVEDLLI